MKGGLVYRQIALGGDPGAVKEFAQAAEDLVYDHIVIYDHVLGAVHEGREPKLTGPYKENDPFHEPLVTYAYLAGLTKNLGLTTGVTILPQRQTALFAKQAADVDLFSDGRLRLGVRGRLELGGIRRSRNVRTFSPPRQAAGAADCLDPQAVGTACGRPCGFRPPDRQSRNIAAAETADPGLAGRFQRGRVRPCGQDRGRIHVFGPGASPTA